MTMTTAVAQARLARELADAEEAMNEALLKQAMLFTTMIAARRDTEVGHFTGHAELMRLNKSQQDLLASGGNLARVHSGLLDIGREVGNLVEDCPSGKVGLTSESIAA